MSELTDSMNSLKDRLPKPRQKNSPSVNSEYMIQIMDLLIKLSEKVDILENENEQ
jgi:hypothetical protein